MKHLQRDERGRVVSGCWQEIYRDSDGEIYHIVGIRIPIVDNGIETTARLVGLQQEEEDG